MTMTKKAAYFGGSFPIFPTFLSGASQPEIPYEELRVEMELPYAAG